MTPQPPKTHLNPTDIGTIYCIGRNWVKHAQELNNPIPTEPLIFTKTRSTLCSVNGDISIAKHLGRCDHELEIAILIDQPLHNATQEQALNAISHYGIALDLTLRDCQTELKQKGHPWFKAKNFDNATPISPLFAFDHTIDLQNIDFSLSINDEIRQHGHSKDMLFSIVQFICATSAQTPLLPGDLFLTGTPEGVGPLHHQDKLSITLNQKIIAEGQIIRP